jgi:glucose/arabinose dehydrogenase
MRFFSHFCLENRMKIAPITSALLLFAASAVFAQPTPKAVTVASGLENPWALAFLPDGKFLVTERPGRMRVIDAQGKLGEPLQNVPQVVARGQGGLLDVITDSAFAQNRTLYFCYAEPASVTEPGSSANSTAVARATLSADNTRLENIKVIFRQMPRVQSNLHFGCRIVEAMKDGKSDGNLFVTIGDRFGRMQDAQLLDNHHGKVLRITKDGGVPKDNPFVNDPKAKPEIWSYGHRNVQGAALAPDGTLWTHEHGPQGGDELNIDQAGKNYGWPTITFGKNYGTGTTIGEGTERAGIEPAVKTWVPSIAPSGMAILTSDKYGAAWKGNVFIGSLKFNYLNRVELAGNKFGKEHKLLEDVKERVRDVRQGPDGLLYVVTDARDGKLIRLQP